MYAGIRFLLACAVLARPALAAEQDADDVATWNDSAGQAGASGRTRISLGHVHDDDDSIRKHWALLVAGSRGWGAIHSGLRWACLQEAIVNCMTPWPMRMS